MKKKLHWTQTPEGKAKLAKNTARAWKQRRAKTTIKTEPTSHGTFTIKDSPIFAYALGHVTAWVETYAKSAGVPYEALATELGKILQVKARR
jgi:hypothetical protein